MAEQYSRSDIQQVIDWINNEWGAICEVMDDPSGYEDPGELWRGEMDELYADVERLNTRFQNWHDNHIGDYIPNDEQEGDDDPEPEYQDPPPMNETERLHQRLRNLLNH